MERTARQMGRESVGGARCLIVESGELAEPGAYRVDPRARRVLRVEKKKRRPQRLTRRPAPKVKSPGKPKAGAKKRR